MPPADPRSARTHGPDELAALEALAAGASSAGPDVFAELVARLVGALGVDGAEVMETAGEGLLRPLAAHPSGRTGPLEARLAGSAAAEALAEGELRVTSGAAARFAADALLAERAVEGYLGASLRGPDGSPLGVLFAWSVAPLDDDPRQLLLFRAFAARAAAELARLCVERTLGESEERFRDLFEEAPIAYVHEDLETRFIRANRAALRILGLRPDQVTGTIGRELLADNPDNMRRLRAAFESVGRGTDTSGVVLELVRRSDGRPAWIQWWSKPDPSGAYTRTMFVDITDRVLMEREQARLTEQNRYLREEIKASHNFDEIIGRSPALAAVLSRCERVANTEATVLIAGETGTGKELIARAIHSASRRHDKPLIKVNCAALPPGLVESELFGHEKGAFSGALTRRVGRFELAHGGTIFLDEIGEMPLDVQAKLLRVLQEREFERVGSSATIETDVRVIAATNRDLLRAIHERRFREDLYYRLNVFPIQLPPLRERPEDVPLLTQFFVKRCSARIGKPVEGVTDALMERLLSYAWPGNVRELENLLERAVILANGPWLDVDTTLFTTGSSRSAQKGLPKTGGSLETVERDYVVATLERVGWVIDGPAGAAKVLDLHPNTLRSRMRKLGIARPSRTS